jgi:hypothetical protein
MGMLTKIFPLCFRVHLTLLEPSIKMVYSMALHYFDTGIKLPMLKMMPLHTHSILLKLVEIHLKKFFPSNFQNLFFYAFL